MAKFVYQGFNVGLAVQACRILMIETHLQAECSKMVYEPTRRLLEKLALNPPSLLLCMHGPTYTYGGFSGSSSEVHIVMPDKNVFYLATIMSQAQARSAFNSCQTELQELLKKACCVLRGLNPEKAVIRQKLELQKSSITHKLELLKQRGEMAIVFDRVGCKIPVNSDKLDISALTQGVKRYFQTFVPQLGETAVVWMPPKTQQALRKFIREKAEQISTPQTFEERRKIIAQDL